jgi:hypothetical protein
MQQQMGSEPAPSPSPTVLAPAVKGGDFDWAAINVQTREQFDALSPGQQELLKMMKRGVKFSGAQAAEFVVGIEQRINDPAYQADLQRKQMEIDAKAQESRAKAQENLFAIQTMRQTIEGLEDHPGFRGAVGAKRIGNYFPGTKEADFRAMLEQLQGGVFLQAYQSLKGGGPITDIEGEKAERALARLNPNQSEEGFRASLNDFRSLLAAAESRIPKFEDSNAPRAAQGQSPQAGQPQQPQQQTQQASPAVPAERIIGGKRFILNERGKYVPAG